MPHRRAMPAATTPASDAVERPRFEEAPRVPALDGLRGLAVLLVLLAHTAGGPTAGPLSAVAAFVLRHGWMGVDLFFVLSGFLITRILIATRGDPRYFRNFWARRALRIFPLYYVFLVGWLVLLPALAGESATRARALATAPWYATYTFNILLAREGWSAALPGTVHLWSLSVEEQFYLGWPVLVRLVPTRALPRVLAAMFVATIGARWIAVFAGLSTDAAYVLTPLRLDALLAGALVAALGDGDGDRLRRWLRVAGPAAAVLLLATVSVEGFLGELAPARRGGMVLLAPTGFARVLLELPLVAILGAWLVWRAAAGVAPTRGERLLLTAPARSLGRVSYGVYVLHLPLIVVLERIGIAAQPFGAGGWRTAASWMAWTLVVLAASTGAAAVSWVVLERRALGLKRYFVPAAPGRQRLKRWPRGTS